MATCPRCGSQGTLAVGVQLVAKPIGSFSLAGAQDKVSAVEVARADCSACGLSVTGRLENATLGPDGVTFTGGHFVADRQQQT